MKKFDVIIIGSGISSLVSALILTKHGRSVGILEQHSVPGGYTHSFTKNGIMYDTGAHYVGALARGMPFHTLLTYLGICIDDLIFPLGSDGGYDVMEFPSFKVEYACGYEQTISNLCALFASESAAIRGYFKYLAEAARQLPTYEYDGDGYDESVMQQSMNTTLQEVLDSFTYNLKLQSALSAYCTLHGALPQDVPFAVHAVVTDSLMRSVHGLKNGGSAVVSALLKKFKEQGGEIFLSERVERLDIDNSLITRIITANGNCYAADWVLSGAHPKIIFSLIRDQLKKSFTSRLDTIGESASFLKIYGRFRDVSYFAPRKNYYYFQSEVPEKCIKVGGPQDVPSCIFLSHPNAVERASGQTILIPAKLEWFNEWKNLNRRERTNSSSYQKFKYAIAQDTLELLNSKKLPMGDWETWDVSTPLTIRDFNGSIDGSAYGVYHSIDNTGARALGPRTHIRNLVLTGQSTLFPGLLGAAISGLRSSGHLVGIKPLLAELKKIKQENK